MAQYDPTNSIIRLLDKTNSTPTGTTDGGLINGDLIGTGKMLRLVLEEGQGKIPSAILYLKIDNSGQFETTAPILTDKDAYSKYLLETKIAEYVNGALKFSKLHRFNLSTPLVVNDKDLGWSLMVPCEHIAMETLTEIPNGLNSELVSPHDRIKALTQYYITGVDTGDILMIVDAINIPDDDVFKQDYFPTALWSLDDAIQDVFARLQQSAASGIPGDFKNYYYSIEADATETLSFHILFEEFGAQDSGVVISSTSAQQASLSDTTGQTSNKKRRNKAVVAFHPRYGALPTEFTDFASAFQHALFRPEWSGVTLYKKGDTVKYTFISENPYVIRFFLCRVDMAVNLGEPDLNTTQWKEDFTVIPNWSSDAFYTVGEIVAVPGIGTISFYRCITENGPSSVPPNANWTSSMNTRVYSPSTYVDFVSYTPWTSDLQTVKTNLCCINNPPTGYIGMVPDWNYERQINDLVDYTNRYQGVTGKSVRRWMTAPPSSGTGHPREPYTGLRILVAPSATGAFSGHDYQIAEYQADPLFINPAVWNFSSDPAIGDTIFIEEQGNFVKWEDQAAWVNGNAYNTKDLVFYAGSIYICKVSIPHSVTAPPSDPTHWFPSPIGQWVTTWGVDPSSLNINLDKPGPAHLVKRARLVKGATDIPGQAIEYRFDWEAEENFNNKTSRGAWFSMFYPQPKLDASTANLGYLYGGGLPGESPTFNFSAPPNPMVDHQNTSFTKRGEVGWNRGKDSETMGRISSHTFKMKLSYWTGDVENDASLVYGKANIPMIYWRKDANGRIFFADFVYPVAHQWWPVNIELPPFGDNNLYFNRLDELVQVYGYTLPIDIFIQQKDYSGVQFEWRKNQSWGVFTKETYTSIGMYQGCYQTVIDQVSETLGQAIPNTIRALEYIAQGNFSALATLLNADPLHHTTLAIDELHYVKEGYAIYPEEIVTEARIDKIDYQQETDYLNALGKAQSTVIRDQFFPNERYPNITGNSGVRYGQKITETGSRIPGGSLTSVVANQKDVIDNSGYTQSLYLIRKFVV